MRKFLRLRLMIYVLFILSVAFASGQAKGVLTNQDISDMLKGGIPETRSFSASSTPLAANSTPHRQR